MSVNASRTRQIPDAEVSVTLREGGIPPLTGAGVVTSPSVSLRELRSALWHDSEIAFGKLRIGVHVTHLDLSGTNSYKIGIAVDDSPGHSDNPVTVIEYPIAAPGTYEFVVPVHMLAKLDPDGSGGNRYLASKATLAGDSTPSLNYRAWIGKAFGP